MHFSSPIKCHKSSRIPSPASTLLYQPLFTPDTTPSVGPSSSSALPPDAQHSPESEPATAAYQRSDLRSSNPGNIAAHQTSAVSAVVRGHAEPRKSLKFQTRPRVTFVLVLSVESRCLPTAAGFDRQKGLPQGLSEHHISGLRHRLARFLHGPTSHTETRTTAAVVLVSCSCLASQV